MALSQYLTYCWYDLSLNSGDELELSVVKKSSLDIEMASCLERRVSSVCVERCLAMDRNSDFVEESRVTAMGGDCGSLLLRSLELDIR